MQLDPFERLMVAVAKGVIWVPLWLIGVIGVYRVLVPMVWGSRSDLGLILAPAIAVGAGAVFLFLAYVIVRDLARTITPSDDKD